MLTASDIPTIKNAIMKRLDHEPGVAICEILAKPYRDHIRVGILALLDDLLTVQSRFDLPPQFSIYHLRNEIDQVAEQYKASRKDFFGRGAFGMREVERQLAGTGLRGLWPQ